MTRQHSNDISFTGILMENPADVLIVTVTAVESRAVLAAFERATGQKARSVAIGDRVYRDLGTLQRARVFLALSEMGAGGLGASQQTVQKGIAALRPQAVVMVGIAFGMNEQKQAVGDILVSRQLMLYDLQRVGASQIIPRGDRPHGSGKLLNYLSSAELDWEGAPVRFGLLLTGDKLVDDIDYREQLKRLEAEAIGGEMEGAGLYVACQDAKVDWVVVKGICDWGDGNKEQHKEARQKMAADSAAAFVVHALQHAAFDGSDPPNPKAAVSELPPNAAAFRALAADHDRAAMASTDPRPHLNSPAILPETTRSHVFRLTTVLAVLAVLVAATLIGYHHWFSQDVPSHAGRFDMSLRSDDRRPLTTAAAASSPPEMILISARPRAKVGSVSTDVRLLTPTKPFWIDHAEVGVAEFSQCPECIFVYLRTPLRREIMQSSSSMRSLHSQEK